MLTSRRAAIALPMLAAVLLAGLPRLAESQSSTGPDLCTSACHGKAMRSYNEALAFGAEEPGAIQAGNATSFACLADWCGYQ